MAYTWVTIPRFSPSERSADEQPLITKRLSIYTNVDIAKKKLRVSVEVGACTSIKIDPH